MEPTKKKIYKIYKDPHTGKAIAVSKPESVSYRPIKTKNRISIAEWKDKQELARIEKLRGLQRIYHSFFLPRMNAKHLLNLLNTYSIADAILTSSGDTNILIEYKNRFDISSYTYFNGVIEKQKFDNLETASKLLDVAPGGTWYVMDYYDVVCIWKLDFNKDYHIDEIPMPASETDSTMTLKPIYYLDFRDAIVVSKKTWRACPDYELFANYLNTKRNQ